MAGCYDRDRAPRLTNRDTPYIPTNIGHLPPQKNGRRPMFDREAHEKCLRAVERLLAGDNSQTMGDPSYGIQRQFRPIYPVNNPKGKGKGAFQQEDPHMYNPYGNVSDFFPRMKGKGKGNKGKGKGKGKNTSEESLDRQLNDYMGPSAAFAQLDTELDQYFDASRNAGTE